MDTWLTTILKVPRQIFTPGRESLEHPFDNIKKNNSHIYVDCFYGHLADNYIEIPPINIYSWPSIR